ncbi:hypothetical protein APSETT445_009368 [Aspergillus pseudonomiae]
MLKSYRDSIYQNRHIFKDKVVLDVGCGTGILSMFAAKAGAKHVIGVDMSSIIEKAKEIVACNGLSDRVTLLQGKMEEVVLPYPKVDIIISEWMGYFLLYESMLDTVLYARDRYLVPGGKIFPDKATMYLAAIEDGEYKDDKIGCKSAYDISRLFWDNVYGFDYSPMKEIALTEPLVDTVELKALVTDPCPIITLDLYTVTPADLAFKVPFSLAAKRSDFIHAVIAWFDIEFGACHKPITFSTGPHAKYTHWKQTVFYLRDVLTVEEEEVVSGVLENKPNDKNKRDLDITISYKFETTDNLRYSEGSCSYRIIVLMSAPGVGFEYPPQEVSWLKRDALLFANSIAFKHTDQEVIDFYARSQATPIPGVPKFDTRRGVDGQRKITILKPLPPTSEGKKFQLRNKVIGVYDKGKAGSVVETEQSIVDESGEVYTKTVSSGFMVGQGNWGGPKGPSAVNYPPPQGKKPDAVHVVQTTAETPLLYRLNGDYNPLHATPEPGQKMGFGGVIIHGLFSWNTAAHGILRELGGSDPKNLREFQARFASPVFPGDKLTTEIWRTGNTEDGFEEVRFVTTNNKGKVVLSNGRCLLKVTGSKSKL